MIGRCHRGHSQNSTAIPLYHAALSLEWCMVPFVLFQVHKGLKAPYRVAVGSQHTYTYCKCDIWVPFLAYFFPPAQVLWVMCGTNLPQPYSQAQLWNHFCSSFPLLKMCLALSRAAVLSNSLVTGLVCVLSIQYSMFNSV